MSVHVVELALREWFSLCVRCVNSSFGEAGWFSACCGRRGRVVAVMEGNSPKLFICGYQTSAFPFLETLYTPPFTPVAGPFLCDMLSAAEVRAFMRFLLGYLHSRRPPFLRVILKLDYSLDGVSAYFHCRSSHTRRLFLHSLQTVWEKMGASRRNDIRQAMKSGLATEQLTNAEEISLLLTDFYRRRGLEFDASFVSVAVDYWLERGKGYCFAVLAGERPVAVAFCVVDELAKGAYYIMGGRLSGEGGRGAGALCLWECIKYAGQAGLRFFDFEGSEIPSIDRFFKEFGAFKHPLVVFDSASGVGCVMAGASRALRRFLGS